MTHAIKDACMFFIAIIGTAIIVILAVSDNPLILFKTIIMWLFNNKKGNKFVKKVTITKCTLHSDVDEIQYQVKVNGSHVSGGCVKTLEEAIKVHDRYCNSKYGTMETELIKETLI